MDDSGLFERSKPKRLILGHFEFLLAKRTAAWETAAVWEPAHL
jgi:hypothetical protein